MDGPKGKGDKLIIPIAHCKIKKTPLGNKCGNMCVRIPNVY